MSEMLSSECLQLRQRFDVLSSPEPHFAACAACASEYASWQAMNNVLASVAPVTAPGDLLDAVLATLPAQPGLAPIPRFDWLGDVVTAWGVAVVPALIMHLMLHGDRAAGLAWNDRLALIPMLLDHLPWASLSQGMLWMAVGFAISHAFLQAFDQQRLPVRVTR